MKMLWNYFKFFKFTKFDFGAINSFWFFIGQEKEKADQPALAVRITAAQRSTMERGQRTRYDWLRL